MGSCDKVWRQQPPPSMTEPEDDQVESNMTVVLAGCIGGFLGIIISLVVCYIKRWCCFACRSDYPEDVTEMSGPRIAEAYRTDVNTTLFKIMTGKQKVPPPPSP